MSYSQGGDEQVAASDLSAMASHPSSSSNCTQVASEEGTLTFYFKSFITPQRSQEDVPICCEVSLCECFFIMSHSMPSLKHNCSSIVLYQSHMMKYFMCDLLQ